GRRSPAGRRRRPGRSRTSAPPGPSRGPRRGTRRSPRAGRSGTGRWRSGAPSSDLPERSDSAAPGDEEDAAEEQAHEDDLPGARRDRAEDAAADDALHQPEDQGPDERQRQAVEPAEDGGG